VLNRNFIRGIEIDLPPVSEQRRIADVLAPLDDKAASNLKLANAVEAVVEAPVRPPL
jgi:restriction endonuclease S subunit